MEGEEMRGMIKRRRGEGMRRRDQGGSGYKRWMRRRRAGYEEKEKVERWIINRKRGEGIKKEG